MEDHTFHGSSNVRSARYDPTMRTVSIQFHHGRTYPPITGVSPAMWASFKRSDSPGGFINKHWRTR